MREQRILIRDVVGCIPVTDASAIRSTERVDVWIEWPGKSEPGKGSYADYGDWRLLPTTEVTHEPLGP